MPAKIRLQRQGRKFKAIYSIVVADSRAPRDGRFIEDLGQYNPNTNPATIVLDFNKALDWLMKGAQPTDTCRAILSYKGVMYKKHLLEGVRKGAFDEAEAEKRFQAWMTEKEQKIQANKDNIKSAKDNLDMTRMEAESKIKEDRAAEIAKRKSDLIEAEAKAEAGEVEEVEAAEEPAAEAPAATEGTEASAEEQAAPVEEKPAEEPKAEEPVVEEPKAEEPVAEEKPAEEPVAEEKPAEEPVAEEKPAEEPKAEEKPAEEPKAEDEKKDK
jgi:small subunit ribosomal protein S16